MRTHPAPLALSLLFALCVPSRAGDFKQASQVDREWQGLRISNGPQIVNLFYRVADRAACQDKVEDAWGFDCRLLLQELKKSSVKLGSGGAAYEVTLSPAVSNSRVPTWGADHPTPYVFFYKSPRFRPDPKVSGADADAYTVQTGGGALVVRQADIKWVSVSEFVKPMAMIVDGLRQEIKTDDVKIAIDPEAQVPAPKEPSGETEAASDWGAVTYGEPGKEVEHYFSYAVLNARSFPSQEKGYVASAPLYEFSQDGDTAEKYDVAKFGFLATRVGDVHYNFDPGMWGKNRKFLIVRGDTRVEAGSDKTVSLTQRLSEKLNHMTQPERLFVAIKPGTAAGTRAGKKDDRQEKIEGTGKSILDEIK